MPTTKSISQKYTKRKSPPIGANQPEFRGTKARGNDGRMYISKANVNGVFSWRVVHDGNHRTRHSRHSQKPQQRASNAKMATTKSISQKYLKRKSPPFGANQPGNRGGSNCTLTHLTNMKKARRNSRLSRGSGASSRASKTGPGPKSRSRPKPKLKPVFNTSSLRGPKPKVKPSNAARRGTRGTRGLRGGAKQPAEQAAQQDTEPTGFASNTQREIRGGDVFTSARRALGDMISRVHVNADRAGRSVVNLFGQGGRVKLLALGLVAGVLNNTVTVPNHNNEHIHPNAVNVALAENHAALVGLNTPVHPYADLFNDTAIDPLARASMMPEDEIWQNYLDSHSITPAQPRTLVKAETIEETILALLDGFDVDVPNISAAHTLIETLGSVDSALQQMAKDGKLHDIESKELVFDLCQVQGVGSFCSGNRGIPRYLMPQTAGEVVSGSAAEKLLAVQNAERLAKGGSVSDTVEGSEAFVAYLLKKGGITTSSPTRIRSDKLKATQRDMQGHKVAGMLAASKAGKYDPSKQPIFVSKDGYVVDGHHRWAATLAADFEDGILGNNHFMNVIVIDAPLSEIIRLANEWTDDFGIAKKHVATTHSVEDRAAMFPHIRRAVGQVAASNSSDS